MFLFSYNCISLVWRKAPSKLYVEGQDNSPIAYSKSMYNPPRIGLVLKPGWDHILVEIITSFLVLENKFRMNNKEGGESSDLVYAAYTALIGFSLMVWSIDLLSSKYVTYIPFAYFFLWWWCVRMVGYRLYFVKPNLIPTIKPLSDKVIRKPINTQFSDKLTAYQGISILHLQQGSPAFHPSISTTPGPLLHGFLCIHLWQMEHVFSTSWLDGLIVTYFDYPLSMWNIHDGRKEVKIAYIKNVLDVGLMSPCSYVLQKKKKKDRQTNVLSNTTKQIPLFELRPTRYPLSSTLVHLYSNYKNDWRQ